MPVFEPSTPTGYANCTHSPLYYLWTDRSAERTSRRQGEPRWLSWLPGRLFDALSDPCVWALPRQRSDGGSARCLWNGCRGKIADDGMERITTQLLFDIL